MRANIAPNLLLKSCSPSSNCACVMLRHSQQSHLHDGACTYVMIQVLHEEMGDKDSYVFEEFSREVKFSRSVPVLLC